MNLREIQAPLHKAENKLEQATWSYEVLNTDVSELKQSIQSLKQQANAYVSARHVNAIAELKLQELDQQLATDKAAAEKLPQAEKEHRAYIKKMQQVEAESNSIKELNKSLVITVLID